MKWDPARYFWMYRVGFEATRALQGTGRHRSDVLAPSWWLFKWGSPTLHGYKGKLAFPGPRHRHKTCLSWTSTWTRRKACTFWIRICKTRQTLHCCKRLPVLRRILWITWNTTITSNQVTGELLKMLKVYTLSGTALRHMASELGLASTSVRSQQRVCNFSHRNMLWIHPIYTWVSHENLRTAHRSARAMVSGYFLAEISPWKLFTFII